MISNMFLFLFWITWMFSIYLRHKEQMVNSEILKILKNDKDANRVTIYDKAGKSIKKYIVCGKRSEICNMLSYLDTDYLANVDKIDER